MLTTRARSEKTPNAQDQTSAVFDEAADTLDQAAAGARGEARRIRGLRRERAKARTWREVLGAGVGRNLLEDLALTAGQMSSVAGQLRRAIVHALLAEGQRVKQIAESLGVSHQRISHVLSRNAEDET